MSLRVPMLYLVDSAGARITDQIEMFPGRRGAGRIFYNQVQMSGRRAQVCLLFGPSAAGGAYIPAFCDVVAMVDGNASMYLGSPRMAEMVIGEKVTLEEMGGAKMHCSVSGCGDVLCKTEDEAIAFCKRYLANAPELRRSRPRAEAARRRRRAAPHRRDHPRRREQGVRHDGRHPRDHRRGLVARDQGALRPRDPHRLRAHRGAGRRHRRQPAQVAGRRALRRQRGQGGAVHLALRRLQHPAPLPGRRPRLHDWHQGRASGDHPRRARR